MEFILTGFRQTLSIRHYLFQVIATDRTRHDVSVDADLDLMRRYGISIQEMPLLARRLLEAGEAGVTPADIVIFSEKDMVGHAKTRDEARSAQDLRRRRPVKPPSANRPPEPPRAVGAMVADVATNEPEKPFRAI